MSRLDVTAKRSGRPGVHNKLRFGCDDVVLPQYVRGFRVSYSCQSRNVLVRHIIQSVWRSMFDQKTPCRPQTCGLALLFTFLVAAVQLVPVV